MSTPILGQPEATAFQLRNYLHKSNPDAPDYSQWYITLGNKYGVRGDIAFCQSILETGYWRFGGDVLPEQNNFAGLGATSGSHGVTFSTPQAGIEAQMQHLYAYATTLPLPANTIPLDPRFQLVTRGSVGTWEGLSGHWASDPAYGQKIMGIYQDLITTQAVLTPPSTGTGTTTGTTTDTPAPTPTTPAPTTPVSTTAPGTTATPTHVPLPSDTPPGQWYTPYVQQMLDLGIMQGTGDNKFQPTQPATRAELAVALYNLYKLLHPDQTT